MDKDLRVLSLELLRLALGDLETRISADAQLGTAAPFHQQPDMPVEGCGESMGKVAGLEFDTLGHALSEHRNKSRTIR